MTDTPSNTSIPELERIEALLTIYGKLPTGANHRRIMSLIEAHSAFKVKEAHTLGQLDGLELAMRAVAVALEQRNTDAIQQIIDTLRSSLDQTDSDTTRRASDG